MYLFDVQSFINNYEKLVPVHSYGLPTPFFDHV